MNLFICGSRTIDDIKWISTEIEKCIAENQLTDITILEGYTNIVDSVAGGWASINNIPEITYPSDLTYHQRHEAMTKDCDFMLVLWNGEYVDCFYDIMMAEKYHKQYSVCVYSKDEVLTFAINYVLENNKEIFQYSENVKEVFILFKKAINIAAMKYTFMETEWEEGNTGGSSFLIMPCNTLDDNSISEWGCPCCLEEAISIDDEIIQCYLYLQFLKPHFDKSIKYTYKNSKHLEFDWHGQNIYSYETVRKMTDEMKKFSKEESLKNSVSNFYNELANRLLLMMERNSNWNFINFEGPWYGPYELSQY